MGAILSILGGALGSFFTGVFKTLAEFFIAKKLGSTEQALSVEKQADAKIEQAEQARNSVNDLTVDELPAHNSTNDPDFRD